MSESLKERMKRIVEEKKQKSSQQASYKRHDKGGKVEPRAAFKNKKQGGLFDK